MDPVRPMPASSERAWRAFRARVEELGGVVLEPSWLGVNRPHRIRCKQGHENTPRPGDVQQGKGICRTCAGLDPAAAERAFRARVEELGGVVLEPVWLGKGTPHRIRCKEGHETSTSPGNTRSGWGICRICADRDPAAAEQAFRARVEALGGVVLERSWLGALKPHQVRCSAGHESFPRPNAVQQGQGICWTCAGTNPAAAERAFRARVEELGGVVLEPVWLGADLPHRIRCKEGHENAPRPGDVQQGNGICRTCAGLAWDAFYVVRDDTEDRVKFGITSGDPRARLKTHARDGYRRVLRLLVDLSGDTAPSMERAVLAALRLAGQQPIRGREYFPAEAVALVLDVVDNYPLTGAS